MTQAITMRNDAQEHSQALEWPQFLASTTENGQSEFLQLLWQAIGLSLLLWASSRSRESDERIEATIDRLPQLQGRTRMRSREVNSSL